MQLALISLVAGLGASVGAYFYGQGVGKVQERVWWQEQNAEVLIGANSQLADLVNKKDQALIEAKSGEINSAADTESGAVEIRHTIREVPIDRVVEIEGDCDTGYRIGYESVRVSNAWATGDRYVPARSGGPTPAPGDYVGGRPGQMSAPTSDDELAGGRME